MIGAWATKYVPDPAPEPADESVDVLVRETGQGTYQNAIAVGRHRLTADEPIAAGGFDSGPTPYDFLAIALGGVHGDDAADLRQPQEADVGPRVRHRAARQGPGLGWRCGGLRALL